MTCTSGPPCMPGNTLLSMAAPYFSLARIMPARGPRSVLCVVDVTISAHSHGIRMQCRRRPGRRSAPCRPGRARRRNRRSGGSAAKSSDARIGAAARDDHLRLVLFGQAREFVVIDALVVLAHAVGHDLVGLAGKIQRMAVRQVAAVRQIHAEDGVAGLQHGGVGGLIGLRAGVRLDVGVLGAEELLGAVARQVLDDVGELAAAVVALAGIAFGVLVGEDAAGGFEDRLGGEVLAGDQFEARILALGFLLNRVGRSPGQPRPDGRAMRFCSGFISSPGRDSSTWFREP